tara:strand:- start:2392 stop:3246 length:855 start_codon:yes stop_codon:yes gene_type:complete
MDIVELILDEESEEMVGIEAVSIVSAPAIEESFLALSSDEIKLAKVDGEKRIVMGCALVPNKMIFRKRNDTTFYVYFSEDTVRRASELFFQNGNQSNATLEHQMKANNLTVVESWIVEDEKKDKSAIYGLNAPVGSWVISMKIEDDELWQQIKEGKKYTGFSIEGYFADKASIKKSEMSTEEVEAELILSKIKDVIIKAELHSEVINDDFAIINDRLAYSSQEKAEEMAQNIGCEGFHIHEYENKEWFMPCEKHEMKKPCYDGYEMIGFKIKNGKKVPNCVPIK